MADHVRYLYSVLRLVPRIERGEAMNIGLVMFSRPQRFLNLAYAVDADRIQAFAPQVDVSEIEARLQTLARIAVGDSQGGPVAALDIGERFHWLTNVSNTIIQPGEVHPGLTVDAEATFDRLFHELVAPVHSET